MIPFIQRSKTGRNQEYSKFSSLSSWERASEFFLGKQTKKVNRNGEGNAALTVNTGKEGPFKASLLMEKKSFSIL